MKKRIINCSALIKDLKFKMPEKPLLLFVIINSIVSFMWFLSITIYGSASFQFNLFFQSTNDFLADFFNVVGYCGYNDPYNCTVYWVTLSRPS